MLLEALKKALALGLNIALRFITLLANVYNKIDKTDKAIVEYTNKQ